MDNNHDSQRPQHSGRLFSRVLNSRRASVSVLAIVCLMILGIINKIDTSMAIASVAAALAGSNAWQKTAEKRGEP